MDAMMPMGFFENTREIYAEVASYPVVPPEKIKQLFDPSAFRLENFWWHVWGSDRLRNLSGQELARLFEEISSGPTFVPLPSPADQFKRSRKPDSNQRAANNQSKDPARPQETSDQGYSLSSGKRGLTPSSSRPPPPHPILKKSRGPSSSGPRPTARFASPPTFSEEAIHDSEATPTNTATVAATEMPPPPLPITVKKRQGTATTNQLPTPNVPRPTRAKEATESPTSAAPVVEMPPPPPVPSTTTKIAINTGRKVVAATAASRRKPVMVRRQSSQSSTGSDSGQRVVGFVAASKRSGSKRPTPTASQLLGHSSSSSQMSDHGLSAKAAGKRKAKPTVAKRSTTQGVPNQANGQPEEAVGGQHSRPGSPQRRSTWDVRDSVVYHEAAEGQQETAQHPPAAPSKAVPPPVAGFVMDQTFGQGAPPMVRSRSNNSDRPQRLREPGVALLPSQATSSVAMASTIARGQFDSETVTSEPVVPEARDIPDRVLFGSQPSSSLLDQQLKPTPPNPAPPIPFGRSKSELTLLLARDRKPKKGEDA
ncbi:hypothetical protein CHGG_06413 [Chaetomium globosum CBS 148.51]|uniref:Nitrogen regulatory protein areA GATA-like domain-containing protein n=1 Tax=Chaetomium globosum (strain ATCC 6205 / CBS 148.51 / DSM 1962 / NBRC 6347 / NRRL 1970) TaxID=306901 RepID=Q2H4K2_CHAGB|nr:uncharacterized protein CHGG_06413 [Chaetomium globosum CBS 148.51]EAQ89794.1 hypothetical protein CHGG_06413 [Chaetomium globosum CBS 148.51]